MPVFSSNLNLAIGFQKLDGGAKRETQQKMSIMIKTKWTMFDYFTCIFIFLIGTCWHLIIWSVSVSADEIDIGHTVLYIFLQSVLVSLK